MNHENHIHDTKETIKSVNDQHVEWKVSSEPVSNK